MRPLKEKGLIDFKVEVIKKKKQYMTKAIEFRRRMLEERERANLRKKKELQQNGSA